MINIRHSVFETNSSSTHSITMCTQDTYDKWENGLLFLCKYDDKKWYTLEEMIDHICQEDTKQTEEKLLELKESDYTEFIMYIHEYDFYTFTSYEEYHEYYEHYEEQFVTDNGETVVAFGYFGYDC